MMGKRHVAVWSLAGLLAVGIVFEGAAQSGGSITARTCDDQIRAAEAEYREGAFAAAIDLASECLNRIHVAPEEAVDAYRMLALAHLKRNELTAARAAVVNLLGADPDYVPDLMEEPPVYVSMVSLVRHALRLDRPAVPVEPLVPRPPAEAHVGLNTAPSVEPIPSGVAAEPTREEQGSFFERPGTWMTVGGVLIGSGMRSGEHVRGIGIGGLGVGAGRFAGIGIGGLGVGGGESLAGVMVGGLVVGSGSRIDGIAVGGLGVGSGQSIRGLAIGGLGIGTGGDVIGGAFALLGVGGGRSVTGLTVAGLGIGAGEHVRGLHAAGVGVVAPRLSGVVAGSIVSSRKVAGVVVAPLYLRLADDGYLRGLSVSAINHVRGHQQGLTVGLINVAHALHGVQLGLLNYAGNNPWPLRLLPGLNLHF